MFMGLFFCVLSPPHSPTPWQRRKCCCGTDLAITSQKKKKGGRIEKQREGGKNEQSYWTVTEWGERKLSRGSAA